MSSNVVCFVIIILLQCLFCVFFDFLFSGLELIAVYQLVGYFRGHVACNRSENNGYDRLGVQVVRSEAEGCKPED